MMDEGDFDISCGVKNFLCHDGDFCLRMVLVRLSER